MSTSGESGIVIGSSSPAAATRSGLIEPGTPQMTTRRPSRLRRVVTTRMKSLSPVKRRKVLMSGRTSAVLMMSSAKLRSERETIFSRPCWSVVRLAG